MTFPVTPGQTETTLCSRDLDHAQVPTDALHYVVTRLNMRLVISEKAHAAKKLAQFLAEGSATEGKHRSKPR